MTLKAPYEQLFTTCRSCLRLTRRQHLRLPSKASPLIALRPLSSTSAVRLDSDAVDRPLWQRTPPAMQMPVRSRRNSPYKVNDDPLKLDRVYANFLGTRESSEQLGEETKWLAVTHKSFDHGRRGFNDRLAFLGKANPQGRLADSLLEAY
jgi:large subunit ribosomal protein L15